MMDIIRSWLTGIVCVAIISAIANSIIPEGAIRKVARLTCGLVMLIAIVKPVAGIDMEDLSSYIVEYKAETNYYTADLQEESDRLLKVIIEEQSCAYILDKADSLGLDCSVTVETKTGDDGYPYPYSVEIAGSASQEQKEELEYYIEANFAIPRERQIWK